MESEDEVAICPVVDKRKGFGFAINTQESIHSLVGNDKPSLRVHTLVDSIQDVGEQFYVHAALQLLQRQSDTRQELRKAWHLVQKLKAERHLDKHACNQLHVELVGMLSTLHSDEKKEYQSNTSVKTGVLKITDLVGAGSTSPTSRVDAAQLEKKMVKRSNSLNGCSDGLRENRCWCILREEKGTLEMFSYSDGGNMEQFVKESNGKVKLSGAMSWLWNDQTVKETRQPMKVIQLHQCYCEAVSPSYGGPNRFHIREANEQSANGQMFEAQDGDQQMEWIQRLKNVCGAELIDLKSILKAAQDNKRYEDALYASLPIRVPLLWLRREIHTQENANGLARRNAKNIPMLQIIRDVERDKIVINGNNITGVDNLIQCLVNQVDAATHFKKPRAGPGKVLQSDSNALPSPTSRLTQGKESKALAFAERVLRGSCRTQGGGDIYDALSAIASNENITICPISHDATPIELDTSIQHHHTTNTELKLGIDIELVVRVKVGMQFKMTNAHDDKCPIVQGTLERTFSYGQSTEPGFVQLEWIS